VSAERPSAGGGRRLVERLGPAPRRGRPGRRRDARPGGAPALPEGNGAAVFRWMSFSGRDSSPAVSPDGRTVAFTSDRDGQPRVWLKQVSGEGEAALTTGPDDFPRFSPDGTQVLFARPDGAGTSLYRAAALGGEARRLLEGATEGDWSPDGRRVAFLRLRSEEGQTVTGVGVAAADGSEPREVAKVPGGMRAPRYAPDGRTLAVVPAPGALLAGAQQGPVLVGMEDGRCARSPRPTPAATSRRRPGPREARSSTSRPSPW
jgi:Tol biopolymer transport system component